jgi:hypothetical protein
MLTFEEESHTYQWNGMGVPNVTRILDPLVDYTHIPRDRLDIARQEGNAIHKMIELDCRDELDVDALPAWMRQRYEAWRRFLRDTQFKVIMSEHRVYNTTYRYAGTFDLFGEFPKFPAFIDIKRSFFAGPVIGLQTAAYLACDHFEGAPECFRPDPSRMSKVRRFALQVNDDSYYRLEPFEDRNDFNVFLAALTLYRWRAKT